MKIFDLFCGTKSIAHSFEEEGFETMTLDSKFRFFPDIHVNILDWDYKTIQRPDIIWASPPCEGFSVAAISRNWEMVDKVLYPISESAERGIKLVLKTLEIIDYFKPEYWFIENPRAALRKQSFMQDLPRETITYCQYGDTRMKPTDIWGIFPKDFPVRACKAGDNCHEAAPRGSKTGTQGLKGSIARGKIPRGFTSLLAKNIKKELSK